MGFILCFLLISSLFNSQLVNCEVQFATTTEGPYVPAISFDDSYLPDCDPNNLDSYYRSNTFIVPQFGNLTGFTDLVVNLV